MLKAVALWTIYIVISGLLPGNLRLKATLELSSTVNQRHGLSYSTVWINSLTEHQKYIEFHSTDAKDFKKAFDLIKKMTTRMSRRQNGFGK